MMRDRAANAGHAVRSLGIFAEAHIIPLASPSLLGLAFAQEIDGRVEWNLQQCQEPNVLLAAIMLSAVHVSGCSSTFAQLTQRPNVRATVINARAPVSNAGRAAD